MKIYSIEWEDGNEFADVIVPGGTHLKDKLFRLADEFPGEVKINYVDKSGAIVAQVPVDYIRVSPGKHTYRPKGGAGIIE